MRFGRIVAAVLGGTLALNVTSVIVRRAESYDFGGRLYFSLTHGNATQGNGQWIDVSADPDSALATFLERQVGKRLSVTLRAGGPLTRDGDEQ